MKHYALLLLAAMMVFGCSKYDDTELRNDVNDLKSRVEKLETWCNTANGQISALQSLVAALQNNDYVTGVSPVTVDGKTGYTITFSKNEAITILNGKDGEKGADGITPVIGVAKHTDGNYYWTVKIGNADATWMLDADGKMIRTTGDKGADGSVGTDGKTPVLSVATDTDGKVYWKVNGEWLLMDGKKVQATGDKGDTGETGEAGKDGDSVFAKNGVTVNADGTVTFILAGENGVTFTLPMVDTIKIFDKFDTFIAKKGSAMTLALNVKKGDYTAIKAEITNDFGVGISTIKATRAASTPWGVKLTEPVFKEDGTIETNGIVEFTFPANITDGEFALLKITLIDSSKGQEHAATRIVEFSSEVSVQKVELPATAILSNGGTKTLTPTFTPADATNKTVTWSSDNTAIATVDANGVVTAVAKGTAVITVKTADGNFEAKCTVTVNDGPSFENESSVDGSSWEQAYEIKNKEQFILLSTRVYSNDYSKWNTKYYKLTADIDLGDNNTDTWIPIGTRNKLFKGHFDGGNHVVKGKLIAAASASETYLGVFGYVYQAEIMNLQFAGSFDVTAVTDPMYYLGGIAGYVGSTKMTNCTNISNLNSGAYSMGGVVGKVSSSQIIACVNKGNISGDNSVGGIAGDASSSSTICGCINTGLTISAVKDYAGGILGFGGNTMACWSNATTVSSTGNMGGVIGRITGSANDCCWKEASGLKGAGDGTITNGISFTGSTPTTDQITAMNTAWGVAQSTGREYRFNATTGEIEKMP